MKIQLFFPLLSGGSGAGTSPSPTSFIPRQLGIISLLPSPRVQPRRHAAQKARLEIFKLLLPTGCQCERGVIMIMFTVTVPVSG